MKRSFYLTLLFAAFVLLPSIQNYAQEEPAMQSQTFTHEMSEKEKALFHLVGKDFLETDPPPGIVNNIAEFDHMESVLIRYPFGISYEVIAGMSEEIMVTTIVSNTGNQNYVTNQYQSHGVNMSNVNFLIAPTETYWTRDYGPMYVRYGDDQIGIVDFIYNRPDRPNDDLIPQKVAQLLGIEWFGMDLIHTGGNYMTDGYGISSSSDLVWEENPDLTEDEINQLVLDYLGINTYHVVPDPNNTYIDHIDCWGKFLDVDKVLIREVPTTHPQYDEIEATADYYAAQTSSWGNTFQVYRVWTPSNEPYTNSIILNDRVFVPITGSQWDDEAIATYEEAMPGYDIQGFTGSWESTDALHCRANGIADRNMLHIKHFPLLGDQPVQTEYEIEASITAYSGSPVIDNEVKVYYKINGGSYQEMTMTHDGGKIYSAILPAASYGSEIDYYISAADQTGKTSSHPFIGAPDPHVFYIGEQLFPGIAVNTTEINAWVNQGDTDIEEFGITNSGQLELTYSIEWTSAMFEEFDYSIPNSPGQFAWDSDTYTELGWTNFIIDNAEGEIDNFSINYQWLTDNYPDEGVFRVQSPAGTEAQIASGYASGNYTVELDAFNGEQMQGTWKLWITDSYGDGGHKASNITITIYKNMDIYPWLSVSPSNGIIQPGITENIQVTCDGSVMPLGDYEGILFIASNDPDSPLIEIPVNFHVDFASGIAAEHYLDPRISHYPNPFTDQVVITLELSQSQPVSLEVYDVAGEKITTIINDKLEEGTYYFGWDGTNRQGAKMKAGIYFYRIIAGDFEKVEKLLMVD
jgi:agmatine/peptidylarginine deiminase